MRLGANEIGMHGLRQLEHLHDGLLGVAPGEYKSPSPRNNQELLDVLDQALAKGRTALSHATDEHLMTMWRLEMAGKVVYAAPRHIALRDSALNHWAHHRGQLTVYLRLLEQPVPALYGPSADERSF